MGRIMRLLVLLSDRSPHQVLPALAEVLPDIKHEPLSVASIAHALQLEPEAMFIDAAEHPSQAFTVLQALHERDPRVPVMLVVERDTIERYPWHEVADEFLYPGAPAPEVRVRLAMLRRRAGSGDGTLTRLGPLALDTETYRVTANGRALDLTFKEFELLRFLASSPGQGLHAARAAAGGLGVRLLRRYTHGRRARATPAREARPRTRAPDRDGAGSGLPLGRPRGLITIGGVGASRTTQDVPCGNDSPGLCAEDCCSADSLV